MDFHSEMSKLAVRMHAELKVVRYEDEEPEAHFDLKLENNRGQEVVISYAQQDEHGYLRLLTKVGESTQFAPERLRQMLQLNAGLVRGAFALSEGDLVLTDTIDASPLDHERAARAILQLARTADQMERAIFGTDRA